MCQQLLSVVGERRDIEPPPSTKKGNVSKKKRLHFITEVTIAYGCG